MRLLLHHGLRFDEPLESKVYKAFIASKPCMICNGESQVHHSVYRSAGNLCSDIFCVPLCVKHHTQGNDCYHKLGRAKFEQVHNVDIDERVWSYLSEFFHKNGIDLRAELVVYLESIIKGIGK